MAIRQFNYPFYRQPGPQYVATPPPGGAFKPFNVRNTPAPAGQATTTTKPKTTRSKNDAGGSGSLMGEDFMQFAGVFADALGRAFSAAQQPQPYAPALATGVRPEITQMAAERQNQAEAINVQREGQVARDRIAQQQLAMEQQQFEAQRADSALQREAQAEQLRMARERFPLEQQVLQSEATMKGLQADLAVATTPAETLNILNKYDISNQYMTEALRQGLPQQQVAGEVGVAKQQAAGGEVAQRTIEPTVKTIESQATTTGVTAAYAQPMAELEREGKQLTVEQMRANKPYFDRLAAAGVGEAESRALLTDIQSQEARVQLDHINKWQDKLTDAEYQGKLKNNAAADEQLQLLKNEVTNATDDRSRKIAAEKLDQQYKVMTMQSMVFDAEMTARREGRMEQASILSILNKLTDSAASGTKIDDDTLNGVAAKTFIDQRKETLPDLANILTSGEVLSGKQMDEKLRSYLITKGNTQDIADYLESKQALLEYNSTSPEEGLGALPMFISQLMASPEVQSVNMPKIPEGVFKEAGLTPPTGATAPAQSNAIIQQVTQAATQPRGRGIALPTAKYPEATPEAIGNAENVEIRGQNYGVVGQAIRTAPAPDYVARGEQDPAFKRFNDTIESGQPVLEFSPVGTPTAMHYKTVWGDYVKLEDPTVISQILNSGPAGLSVITSTPSMQSLISPVNANRTPISVLAPAAWMADMPKSPEQIAQELQAEREAARKKEAEQAARRASWGRGSGGRSAYGTAIR